MRNNFGAGTFLLMSVLVVLGGGLVTYGLVNYNASSGSVTLPLVPVAAETQATSPAVAKGERTSKKVEQLDLTNKQVLTIYGEIGAESYSIAKRITELGNLSRKPIYILINSPGGSVMDGALIVSAIEGSPVPVYTICEQLCASMANIIHQYGHKRYMVDRSFLMGHPASGGVQGTTEQMQSRLGSIRRYVNKFNAYIAKRAGLTLEQYLPMVVSEMWIDAEDATAQGFNDGIVNVRVSPQQEPDLTALDQAKKASRRNSSIDRINIKW